MSDRCRIIGVLDNGAAGITAGALRLIHEAELVIGATRTLKLLAAAIDVNAEQRDLSGQLTQVPSWVAQALEQGRSVVVLASGDPLCHGIAAYLAGKLDRSTLEIIPNVSTLQWAFARLGLSWQHAAIASVHSRDAGEWVSGAGPEHGLYALLQQLRNATLVAAFTSPENSPDRIARMLLAEGLAPEFEILVAQHLLQKDECISDWLAVEQAALQHFADPNIVILHRKQPQPDEALFGLPDERFHQRTPERGLITKREVRAVSLARLELRAHSIVWDIGAGSGAVGLEASRLCPHGHVYAIEKNEADYAIALSNRASLKAANYTLIHGRAPPDISGWPDADAIFIGGSGGELRELILLCLQRLRSGGRLVINFVTIENLANAVETLKESGAPWDVTQLQAARSRPILDLHRMQAENPVWIISAGKPGNE
ncbi:precorrin-6y C5,15-methyltransferase (decarboxylating) subunit CbiE [Candidatus Methylospira mobilis]|uniref:Precorrin-6y C5,15-methyltransferase (Decarboxylating) subunit CbiE n=1 Tax=Candidatus Methylospira mobilis TaxID=1808979 RepID=A0A5Q0BM27_9GAMM|nr:precorrin-6y C5,15-methyltransferase (decarboxylating) subunit CbiE [Candidatus Methylospira mobilis]QFY43281.1 precorrin-6y C5,15-methyltransferase (decarboxylating) subunit CbiE [Candidatus Methylospira mobilis]